jgi:hypothetical protein
VFELPVGFSERLHGASTWNCKEPEAATIMSRAGRGARESQLQPERESE